MAFNRWLGEIKSRYRCMRAAAVPIREFPGGSEQTIVGRLTLVEPPLEAPASGEACGYYRTLCENASIQARIRKAEVDGHLRFEVSDETGVALVELRDLRGIKAKVRAKYEKAITTANPSPELERYLRRIGNPNEGMGVRLWEWRLDEGDHIAVWGHAVWEPWSDERALRANYREPGQRLVIGPLPGVPVLIRGRSTH